MIDFLLLLALPTQTSFQAVNVYSAISITIQKIRVLIWESPRFVDKPNKNILTSVKRCRPLQAIQFPHAFFMSLHFSLIYTLVQWHFCSSINKIQLKDPFDKITPELS
jgi:hypothetical protein